MSRNGVQVRWRRSGMLLGLMHSIMRALAVFALVLMPLNMAANTAHAATSPASSPVSECDMGAHHQPDTPFDPSFCVIACTALPAPGPANLLPLVTVSAVPLDAVPTIKLDGLDLEPVPPPPRAA